MTRPFKPIHISAPLIHYALPIGTSLPTGKEEKMPSASFVTAVLVALGAATRIAAHGSLVIPQTRNAIDRFAPQWKGGYHHIPDFPGTGRWGLPNETCGTRPPSCQEGCSCSNGTEACDVGQSCFWVGRTHPNRPKPPFFSALCVCPV